MRLLKKEIVNNEHRGSNPGPSVSSQCHHHSSLAMCNFLVVLIQVGVSGILLIQRLSLRVEQVRLVPAAISTNFGKMLFAESIVAKSFLMGSCDFCCSLKIGKHMEGLSLAAIRTEKLL